MNEAIEEVESVRVDARLVFDLGVGEPAREPEGVLTEERRSPSEQSIGEAETGEGLIPGSDHIGKKLAMGTRFVGATSFAGAPRLKTHRQNAARRRREANAAMGPFGSARTPLAPARGPRAAFRARTRGTPS